MLGTSDVVPFLGSGSVGPGGYGGFQVLGSGGSGLGMAPGKS